MGRLIVSVPLAGYFFFLAFKMFTSDGFLGDSIAYFDTSLPAQLRVLNGQR
jgi:hypothetical protein